MIKINDLPVMEEIGREEMKGIFGGRAIANVQYRKAAGMAIHDLSNLAMSNLNKSTMKRAVMDVKKRFNQATAAKRGVRGFTISSKKLFGKKKPGKGRSSSSR